LSQPPMRVPSMAQSRADQVGPSERAATRSLRDPRSLLSRIGRRAPYKREQVHEAGVEERAAANAIGVNAQLLTEAHGGEAVGRRVERGAQELQLLEGRPAILLVAGKGLKRQPTHQLGEGPCERALRAEQVEPGEHSANAVNDAHLP